MIIEQEFKNEIQHEYDSSGIYNRVVHMGPIFRLLVMDSLNLEG